jgi:hypothetical protein
MAIGKQTAGLILWGALGATAAQFPVEYRPWNHRARAGAMMVDETAISFVGAKTPARKWKLEDIRELKVAPGKLYLLSYERGYEFTGRIPAAELYRMLQPLMGQRLVYQGGTIEGLARVLWSAPVKHEAPRSASQGTLAFGEDAVVYETAAEGESRTWRYADIDNIASSGPFQLTITTFERAPWHYGDRKDFNFALKQPITEAGYNQLWLQLERKNGKLP